MFSCCVVQRYVILDLVFGKGASTTLKCFSRLCTIFPELYEGQIMVRKDRENILGLNKNKIKLLL